MFKRCKVVMLSTNQKVAPIVLGENLHVNISGTFRGTKFHLYIISDDEIKEGDWCYSVNFKGTYIARITEGCYVSKEKFNTFASKVIATTDKSLGLSDVGKAGYSIDEFHPTLPQLSQSFIEKYIKEYNNGSPITDVLVEYENDRECWKARNQFNPCSVDFIIYSLEDKAKYTGVMFDHYPVKLKVNPKDNTITIKKVKNSWLREEVHNLMMQAWIYGQSKPDCHYSVREEWIESNL